MQREKIKIKRMNLILKTMGNKEMSANDIINKIYKKDLESNKRRNSWRFYVHLNKLFSPMEKMKLIKHVGIKRGEYKVEKTWIRLDK